MYVLRVIYVCSYSLGYNQQRCKRKSNLKLQKDCPFVCTAFDFAKVNKVASVQPIDQDMEELANRVIGKLQNMTGEEFAEVVLEAAE